MYMSPKSSRSRLKEAEKARAERLAIVEALSQGKVSRRELIKFGLFSAAGVLLPIRGLSPFGNSAFGSIPTGVPPSPRFGALPFTQPMPRFDVMQRKQADAQGNFDLLPLDCFDADGTAYPATVHQPHRASNCEYLYYCDPKLGGGRGPVEGRPPGDIWAHQQWDHFPPKIAVEALQMGARANTSYNPEVPSQLNSGIDPSQAIPPRFHPLMPVQHPNTVWTFNGSLPPKLLLGRYGEPILFRHHNRLPPDVAQNEGFGRHTITTHEHNGHHGAENDGFTGAFFYPGQFYDYHWPIQLAGLTTINTAATDPRAGSPDGSGGIVKLPGDWRETMSTHWFHDHMFGFTSQNVYKGNAAMFNLYSALDRGNEAIEDGVNLRLPSGSAKDWGNLDYDVNLMVADKAFDSTGQLVFDIFDTDGFLGDVMTVNFAYKPYFEVERRKYRFRILNASMARFLKIALSDGSPMIQIGNDGNLLPRPVMLGALDEQGTAERYDIVIDFSRYRIGQSVAMVNLAEHDNGRKPAKILTLAQALSGASLDPGVGKFLEFRVVRNPPIPDQSRVPATLIPNPDLSQVPVARTRVFEFGRNAIQTSYDADTAGRGPWGISTNGGARLAADYGRVSAAPRFGTREIWTLKNDGGGWDHPIHIHFEEGQILARDGLASKVPTWEKGRKDVYRLRPGGSITISLQFRDFGGVFMEHCHNTSHEDNAMLMRWEIDDGGEPFLRPLPTPLPTPRGVSFIDPDDIDPTAF
jgi:FtsP/CotA-like multicopper oxidase with cupredoxin domain